MEKFKFLKKEEVEKVPKASGIYAFKNKGKFLYIGKAANLKERIKNHFQQPAYRDSLFLDQVSKIGYLKTDSEIEALILEANLIKKYQPKYNVVWRDDKNYFFVGQSKEDFPRVFLTHQTRLKKFLAKKEKVKVDFLGPFVDGKALKQTLKVLRKVFPFRSCRTIPSRPCLWYHLNRCLGPCLLKSKLIKEIPLSSLKLKRLSQKNVQNLMKILKEGKDKVLRDLKKEMELAAKREKFEEAAKIRDQISSLEKILSHAKIFEPEMAKMNWSEREKILRKVLKERKEISRIEAYDVSNIQGQEATGSMVTFINGLPEKNFYRRFKIKISGKPNDILMIKEILARRLSHQDWPYPDLILIDGGKAQLKAGQEIVRKKLKKIGKIKVMALAKKKNELFIENQKKPILLKNLGGEIFNLILGLRDEAHRFARKYHWKLREEALEKSF